MIDSVVSLDLWDQPNNRNRRTDRDIYPMPFHVIKLFFGELLCTIPLGLNYCHRNGRLSLIFIDAKTHSNYCLFKSCFSFPPSSSLFSILLSLILYKINRLMVITCIYKVVPLYHFLLNGRYVQFFSHFPIINLGPICCLHSKWNEIESHSRHNFTDAPFSLIYSTVESVMPIEIWLNFLESFSPIVYYRFGNTIANTY